MTLSILSTIIFLLLAHVLADFVFQTNAMVVRKREPHILVSHIVIVGLLSWIALGGNPALALGIAATHLIIDAVKIHILTDNLHGFAVDQITHITVIFVAALIFPNAISQGIWGGYLTHALEPTIFVTGAIVSIIMGGYVIKHLMAQFDNGDLEPGLKGAGTTIGILERAIIFVLVIVNAPTAIGFLIAAKSILRFEEAKKAGEYVIIGTLASFTWAITASYLTVHTLALAKAMVAP
ncbi:MAG: DUF3307 domain-containing protein [Planktomarina sp.]